MARPGLVERLAGLREAAPAKVNLYLHVTGQRPDGYHDLDSLAVFAGAHDLVTACLADELTLTIDGPYAEGLPAGPDNLVLRAARGLARMAGVKPEARMTLTKNLPVASGIGGGSADAAATLRVLCRLWELDLKPRALHDLARALGADVPVCLDSVPRRMGGVGEILTTPPSLPRYGMALINPGVSVATPDVFRARTGLFSLEPELPESWMDAGAMARRLSVLSNDLEHAAVSLCPEIELALDALRAIPGCLLARMSGSGATCFGLFETPERARAAALACDYAGWWRWGGAPWGLPG